MQIMTGMMSRVAQPLVLSVRWRTRLLFLSVVLVPGFALPSPGVAQQTAESDTVPLYGNLGDHHHPVTTGVPETQRYFDQGLRLTCAFNHPEAIRAFAEAARLDPDCAMCHWGIALACGPNINAPMGEGVAGTILQIAVCALAGHVEAQFRQAWDGADVDLTASAF